ncbi:STAS domain-containing protein [Fuchsiella alkaliacetigena]|uniref:STAS domain-containing protein n=1 Tax=Fuchsiella alkaliacetigena TaxID=957042 RepID=UPI00200A61D6|nr:STAS domain-containing protein [Fuchsiella alkaliacetigena]MCK8826112.1 STAS domain-containing protein [Fuchsiella alkaliacetigena]
MKMQIKFYEGVNELLVVPEEDINIKNRKKFKRKLLNACDGDCERIIVDFKNVENIDCSALGKLLLINKTLKQQGIELQIKNINSPYVKHFFSLVDLERVIKVDKIS